PFAGLILALAAGCLVAGLPGCGKSSTAPTAPPVTPPNMPRQLTISGNTNVAGPNDTSQLAATVTYSDGSTKTVTASCSWSSRNRSIATISSQGVLTGVALGITTFDVAYTEMVTVRAVVTVRVMSAGK